MAEYEKKVRQIMLAEGCQFLRHGKGDHDVWFNPATGEQASPLYHNIYVCFRQAGLLKNDFIHISSLLIHMYHIPQSGFSLHASVKNLVLLRIVPLPLLLVTVRTHPRAW